MPKCSRCGKSLCNEQSLQNHMRSNICKQQKTVNNLQDYNLFYVCTLHGIILENNAHENIGSNIYDNMYDKDKYYVYQKHINVLITRQPTVMSYRILNKEKNIIPVVSLWNIDNKQTNLHIYTKYLEFKDSNTINFICNIDFTIYDVNDEFLKIYEYIKEECYELSLYDLHTNKYKIIKEIGIQNNLYTEQEIQTKSGKCMYVLEEVIKYDNFMFVSQKIT